MGYRRTLPVLAIGPGLVACGVAGAIAWRGGLWGSLTGAALSALWLCVLNGWGLLRARPAPAMPEAAVAEAEGDGAALRLLLDAAPTPLLAIDGRVARALNRAARRLFTTDDRILPVPAALADPGASHLRHEGRGWRIDRVAVPGGHVVAALIDFEQEERAAEARATAELIEVLGHELLNGLAPIVSLAESALAAAERPGSDPALLHEILGTLARRADGLQRFTEAYRALARLPAPTPRTVDLREMADDLSRLFAGRWPAVGLSVAVEGEGARAFDRDHVAQAVWALLQNAAEAATMAQAGEARVRLRIGADAAGTTIDVEDNGPGIAPDQAMRIFRPFHTTKAEGTGVGLSLARQIALAHGGTLTLEPGARTVFRLHLP